MHVHRHQIMLTKKLYFYYFKFRNKYTPRQKYYAAKYLRSQDCFWSQQEINTVSTRSAVNLTLYLLNSFFRRFSGHSLR